MRGRLRSGRRRGSISQAKRSPDGSAVSITSAIVSAVYADCFYVESDDGLHGIRVNASPEGLVMPVRVDVTGVVRTDTFGEPYIDSAGFTVDGTGSVEPLAEHSGEVGGPLVPHANNSRLSARAIQGLTDTGLLVMASGVVTSADSTGFFVNGGFGPDLRVTLPAGAPDVVVPPIGDLAVVTGVEALYIGMGLPSNPWSWRGTRATFKRPFQRPKSRAPACSRDSRQTKARHRGVSGKGFPKRVSGKGFPETTGASAPPERWTTPARSVSRYPLRPARRTRLPASR